MRLWLTILAAACAPRDLPPRDGAPIEAWAACAPDRRARVGCVLDGDTVDLGACGAVAGERVRLLGIDAPEVASSSGPTECYGDEATDALRSLLSDRDVVMTFDRGCTDPFDRTLAWLLLPDSRDPNAEPLNVSLWMVERGFVRLYLERDDFDRLRYADALLRAEQSARDVGVGLWGACGE
jgi:endonuclease YncB( thermonuclease family)